MPGPKNASQNADGFRFYEWAPPGEEPRKLLSVTSIKQLTGTEYPLVRWMLSNITNVAMGTRMVEWIGPRGGHNKGYRQDGEFPGEFARRLALTKGQTDKLDELRKWLTNTANEPRDMAAIRGTIVHEAIELGIPSERIDEAYIESAIGRLRADDKRKLKPGHRIRPEDEKFIEWSVAQYWHMRATVPFVLLAREPQVYNLTAGYGGSADAFFWFLGEFNSDGVFMPLEGITPEALTYLQKQADAGKITLEVIRGIGGHVTLGDWKTSAGVYTSQIVQVHAYMGAEFVGRDGKIDQRLTDILLATREAAIVHIRPGGWTVHFVNYEEHVMLAFLGSCVYARFLATYPKPEMLFRHDVTGAAEGTEEVIADVED